MFDSKKFCCFQFPFFSTLSFAVVILLIICANSLISNLSLHSVVSEIRISHVVLETRISHVVLENRISPENHYKLVAEVEDDHDHSQLQPPINATAQERISWFKKVLPKFEILKSTRLSRKFEARVEEFLGNNHCRIQFFMTWISPVSSFREREFFAVESLFRAHPKGCLVILSRTLDTAYGYRVLKPLLDFGIKILAATPNLPFLFKDTGVESWFQEIIKGRIDPGEIPFSQNLSNLIRLAVLYKYGGVYLDTDFITLNDFSRLRNSIGAQSVDLFGYWTRLNNAVLIFDKSHQLLHKFLEEFASTFDGNKWGHNGPYLVSRVVERILREKNDFNFTVLAPMAFYPVDWTRIKGLFEKPVNRAHFKWVEAKLIQLNNMTCGVHLWNRQSSGLRIEDGSVISRLISSNHIIGKHADVSKKS